MVKPPYRVMVVDDHLEAGQAEKELQAAVAVRQGTPWFALADVVDTADAAFTELTTQPLDELPDVLVLDDYLSDGGTTSPSALEIMSELCERYVHEDVPLHARTRAVLWTRADPELAYTFCVLGGLQVADKRGVLGPALPIPHMWAALAGLRWSPKPFPTGLAADSLRNLLPWLAAGWDMPALHSAAAHPTGHERLLQPISPSSGDSLVEAIRRMPHTVKWADAEKQAGASPPKGYPVTKYAGIESARDNGWVWVPLKWHHLIPRGAPLSIVIDPPSHRCGLPPAGPLPAGLLPA